MHFAISIKGAISSTPISYTHTQHISNEPNKKIQLSNAIASNARLYLVNFGCKKKYDDNDKEGAITNQPTKKKKSNIQ